MNDEKLAAGMVDFLFGVVSGVAVLAFMYVISPLFTLAVALTGWVVTRIGFYFPHLTHVGAILVSVASWTGSSLLLLPWLLYLDVPTSKAIVGLTTAGVILGLAIARRLLDEAVDTNTPNATPIQLLGINPQMVAPEQPETAAPDLEELFATGIVLGTELPEDS